MSRGESTSQFNFSEDLRVVLAQARRESTALRHEYIGVEHILLALIAHRPSRGSDLLAQFGVEPDRIAATVRETVRPGTKTDARPDNPYTTRAKRVLELSMQLSHFLRNDDVNSTHLLGGIIAERQSIAGCILADAGVTLEQALPLLARANDTALPTEPWT